jgi:hypothetical protein
MDGWGELVLTVAGLSGVGEKWGRLFGVSINLAVNGLVGKAVLYNKPDSQFSLNKMLNETRNLQTFATSSL